MKCFVEPQTEGNSLWIISGGDFFLDGCGSESARSIVSHLPRRHLFNNLADNFWGRAHCELRYPKVSTAALPRTVYPVRLGLPRRASHFSRPKSLSIFGAASSMARRFTRRSDRTGHNVWKVTANTAWKAVFTFLQVLYKSFAMASDSATRFIAGKYLEDHRVDASQEDSS